MNFSVTERGSILSQVFFYIEANTAMKKTQDLPQQYIWPLGDFDKVKFLHGAIAINHF